MRRFAAIILLALMLCGVSAGHSYADTAPTKENGLLLTPVRQFVSTDAGTTKPGSITIANLTGQPLAISFSVKQFSVSDYVYNYKFEAPSNDWLNLDVTNTTLQPNQSQTITYSFVVPKDAAPGGHYYTIFASANLSSQGVNSTIQTAEPIYLTVNGQLTAVSHLQNSSISWLTFGHSVNYSLQPINTGNVYSFVYVSGELHGLFVRPPQTSAAHILIPGKVRSLAGSIPAPVLPGIYQAVYGYKTDSGWIIQQRHIVVYLPPWSIALALAAVILGSRYRQHRKVKQANSETTD